VLFLCAEGVVTEIHWTSGIFDREPIPESKAYNYVQMQCGKCGYELAYKYDWNIRKKIGDRAMLVCPWCEIEMIVQEIIERSR
jgi:hypothetical protein